MYLWGMYGVRGFVGVVGLQFGDTVLKPSDLSPRILWMAQEF
ncbi:MAG: hypothetical protein C5S49_04450 [Candidatus Methanogaster sp.]|nr:MAG: hypothetical protein C5S49_04450 [ANME-2 cluster archaeon]